MQRSSKRRISRIRTKKARDKCFHNACWEKYEYDDDDDEEPFECDECERVLRLFYFECSGCPAVACRSCMEKVKAKGAGTLKAVLFELLSLTMNLSCMRTCIYVML